MSDVQRWDIERGAPAWVASKGEFVKHADHARIVAEAAAEARAAERRHWEARFRNAEQAHAAALAAATRESAAHHYRMGKAEAEARWVEIARQDRMAAHQRGAQEAERQHAKALAEMEQAHAAALAAATRESAAHHYRMGKARGADLALNHDVGDEVMSDISAPKMSANDAIGDILRFNIDSGPAAPSTLTADEWEAIAKQFRMAYQLGSCDPSNCPACDCNMDDEGRAQLAGMALQQAQAVIRIIHDGEATP